MGWNSSTDTGKQVKIYFDNKDDAIRYAKKNDISFDILDPKKRKIIIKSYADNFIKN
jgi:ETC complex I subunit conserved region.